MSKIPGAPPPPGRKNRWSVPDSQRSGAAGQTGRPYSGSTLRGASSLGGGGLLSMLPPWLIAVVVIVFMFASPILGLMAMSWLRRPGRRQVEAAEQQIRAAQEELQARKRTFLAAAATFLDDAKTVELDGTCEYLPERRVGYVGSHILRRDAIEGDYLNLPSVREDGSEIAVMLSMLTNHDYPYLPDERDIELLDRVMGEAYWADRNELVLIASAMVEPEMQSASTFSSGMVAGWMFLWSYGQERMLCAAPVLATNDSSVYASSSSDLLNNLRRQAYESGYEAMRTVR